MVNMSTKLDKETWNGVVSIVFKRSTDGRTDGRTHARTHGTIAALLYPHRNAFTSLFQCMSIVTLTFDLQNQ